MDLNRLFSFMGDKGFIHSVSTVDIHNKGYIRFTFSDKKDNGNSFELYVGNGSNDIVYYGDIGPMVGSNLGDEEFFNFLDYIFVNN